MAEPAARGGKIGLGLGDSNLCIRLIEPDQYVPRLYLLRVFNQHFDRRTGNKRRDLRHLRVHIGIVGADMVAGNQIVPGTPAEANNSQHDD